MAIEAKETALSFVFAVDLGLQGGAGASFFTEISGISVENQAVVQKLVTSDGKEFEQHQPGQQKWGELTLKKGMTADNSLWKWREEVILGQIDSARRNISVTVLDRSYAPLTTFHFYNAWPKKVGGPSLSSKGNDITLEDTIIVYESMSRDDVTMSQTG
jgi:phage tail-like protein